MSTLINQLKKQGTVRGRRWIIKRHSKTNKIREVKMIYNPQEYANMKNPRKMYGDKALLEILIKEKENEK